MLRTIALFGAMTALFALAACVPPNGASSQSKVLVVDAETGAPIPGATVELHYFPSAPEAPDPNRPRATTNAQGEITLQSKAEPAIWQVTAPDYIEQRQVGQQGALPPRYAASKPGGYDGSIHLYRMPEPQLAVEVSDAFTGPLTINLQPAPGFDFVPIGEIGTAFAEVDPKASYVQESAGQREFSAAATADGMVNLVVTPLLYDITTDQLQVRDSTGVLPLRDIANPEDTGRGVWGMVVEDDKQLHHQIRLFVGALDDYKKYAGGA